MYAYNNEDDLIADHPKSSRWDPRLSKEVPVVLTAEQRADILNEDDPYENGSIGSDTIDVEIGSDGKARLLKPLSFHVGQ